MTSADPAVAGRPLRADARRNRARVLEVAQQVFAEEGLAVPIDEIARRAGVGVGTVYRHFPTKDALFEAIIVERLRGVGEAAHELAQGPDAGRGFFAFFELMVRDASLNKALFDALAASGSFNQELTSEARQVMMTGLGELLAKAQEAGEVRADLTAADVKTFMVGCLAMARQGTADPGLIVGVVCDGMRPVSPVRTPEG
ncbi:TetR/AcrR family transcriptional regulator [Kutzneria kofuensis]|uniref:AcrR family transcriptional regulator n=1 Tax=Kutzneria kofuensis TaxID=103725 RepID=A0A7W9KEK0_9PSEU|nr:helix-turn-helix domain-containing protein [Kutzneria kofuensis]MBB5891167.1 AcrR family transcriptional regulator [Kutzneria kofuensis]